MDNLYTLINIKNESSEQWLSLMVQINGGLLNLKETDGVRAGEYVIGFEKDEEGDFIQVYNTDRDVPVSLAKQKHEKICADYAIERETEYAGINRLLRLQYCPGKQWVPSCKNLGVGIPRIGVKMREVVIEIIAARLAYKQSERNQYKRHY